MSETSSSEIVSTKLQRIAAMARAHPTMVLKTLAHHIDIELLRHAFQLTRKTAAPGIDGETATMFAANIEQRLKLLLDQMHDGTYRAPPVRRAYIPKDDGKQRPIGIPTFEDKILQRAITLVLETIYEQEFYDCSYGFRPGRSAHQALEVIWKESMNMAGGYVIEADIEGFFDTLDRAHLRAFLDQRIGDGVIRRMIGKWMNAGVLEEGALRRTEAGTPQGGVVSPLLANVYLHEVLDKWFEGTVKPKLKGRARLIRYADDFVIVVARKDDAERLFEVLPKRFAKFGLRLHPEKTSLLHFAPPSVKDDAPKPPTSNSFDFLGLTHYWGKSRKGRWMVARKTSKKRFTRTLKRIRAWCREHRHDRVDEQQRALSRKLVGHYAYFGITGNFAALRRLLYEVGRVWRYWLSRRSQKGRLTWDDFNKLQKRHPLPFPRIVHSSVAARARP